MFDALLDPVRRWYACDLARDCVVLILQPVETISGARSPSQPAYASLRSETNVVGNSSGLTVVRLRRMAQDV